MKSLTLAFALIAAPLAAQEMPVPSGIFVTIQDVILEPETRIARFRFVAPDLGRAGFGVADLAADFQFLCDGMALPSLARAGWAAREIVVSIASAPAPFGAYDPDVEQYFEGYRIDGTACFWEPF